MIGSRLTSVMVDPRRVKPLRISCRTQANTPQDPRRDSARWIVSAISPSPNFLATGPPISTTTAQGAALIAVGCLGRHLFKRTDLIRHFAN